SLANRASLDDLNSRLESPVPMDRFRVNVVVDGIDAYEEDEMDALANENVELLQVSAAERCVIIATDQKTGHRPKNNILQVLGEYRRRSAETKFSSGLLFGNYMTVGREGLLRTGDRLSFA
ncbi:MAG: MOSC domain-containing protein, partial [Pseudomonadota bacterium]|nr:MOSC domain-containing protein [Pseudomonadota bacterium]